MVVAGANTVEHRTRHVDAERLPGALLDRERKVEPAAPNIEFDVGLVGGHLPFDDVAGNVAVDPHDLVACLHSGERSGRSGGYRHDHGRERTRRGGALDVDGVGHAFVRLPAGHDG